MLKPRNKLKALPFLKSCPLLKSLLLVLISSFAVSGIQAQQASDSVAPEFGTKIYTAPLTSNDTQSKTALAKDFIAVTAHPLATQTAFDVLEKGGSAVDAMVAVQTILGLVEPQSSGLGGGAFVLYYDAKQKKLRAFDGRETAPLKASPELFMSDKTTPMQFFEAVVGGRSVGTPGTVKLLWEMHQRFGKQTWAKLLEPATQLAKNGFSVSERMAASVARDKGRLDIDPEAAAYFYPEGKAIQEGSLLKNHAYADTLESLAKKGGASFYHSDISKAIINKVHTSSNKGFLAQADFDAYKVIERDASCMDYREFNVCGMGPPSSGAISVNQILGILENFDVAKLSQDEPNTWQIIAEASRLAFADRGQYIADPDFLVIPKGLLDKNYLTSRSLLIKAGQANPNISYGLPPGLQDIKLESGNSPEQESTTHFVIVDKVGNIVSMTSTIENAFGSRLMVKGFLLNNELTDFSFLPENNGQLIANRVEAGKRPRSSMAPTIVFKNTADGDKTPYLALGSPGGSRIINFVANTLIRVLDWNEHLQVAFDSPHIINRFGKMEIEQDTLATTLSEDFQKMAYPISQQDINSGLHGVIFHQEGMLGAADKRREGTVKGK
jgi:gamma-glutamyltranspeptidase/glutathione hydrolase